MRMTLLSLVLSCTSVAFAQNATERELVLGRQMAAGIDSRQQMVADAEVNAYLNGILRALSRDQLLRLPITLKVVDNAELIASALPGGFLVLSSGAVRASESEAELAGLIAHAMGHVQAGQSFRTGQQIGKIPLVFIGGVWGFCLRSGPVQIPAGAQNEFLEEEADILGLGYLAAAGYDPHGLATVYERRHGKFGPSKEIAEKADLLGKTRAEMILSTDAFEHVKALLTPPQPLRHPPSLN